MWSKTTRIEAREMALRVAQHTQFAMCSFPRNLIEMYDRLDPPFRTSSDRSFAWAVCAAIARMASIETKNLKLEDAYVACAIALYRYKLMLNPRPPPAYSERHRPTHML